MGLLIDTAKDTASTFWDAARATLDRYTEQARYHAETYRNARAAYDGASRGRRTAGWTSVSSDSVNAENEGSLQILRDRCRDLARNTWAGRRAVNSLKHNVVRNGIRPAIKGNDEVEARIKKWARYPWLCDADERKNLYGIQSLAFATMVQSGEAFIVRRRTPMRRGGVSMELQLLEPDWVDEEYSQKLKGGNFVIQGVEFNARGKRVAYHMFREHPGDIMHYHQVERRRVPADDVVHLFRELRPGQVRGIPDFAPIILKLRDWDNFEDAQLVRQKIAACFTAFVTSSGSVMPSEKGKHAADELTTKVQPGMIARLKPGEEIKFGQPPSVEDYRDYASVTLHEIAAGMDIPYEVFLGDYSEVNYSSARMGSLEFDRKVDHDRDIVLKPQFLYRLELWLAEALAVEGLTLERTTWTAPKREMIDPGKETRASIEGIRGGITSRQAEIRKRGKDPEEVNEEIAEDNEIADEMGFVHDSDPRKQNANGTPNTSNEEDQNAA